MIFICYLFMSDVVGKHLIQNTESLLDNEQFQIEAVLQEFELTLDDYTHMMRNMILQGDSAASIQHYIDNLSGFLANTRQHATSYKSIYAYIEALPSGPVLLKGPGSHLPEDFNPKQSAWYQNAVKANGMITKTLVNERSEQDETVFTYARSEYDDAGRLLGVFCIDMSFDVIVNTVIGTAIEHGSIGLLINSDMTILAHNNRNYIGLDIHNPYLPFHSFADELENQKNIEERPLSNYLGVPSVSYFRPLPNGWYLGLVLPKKPYYQSVTNMSFMLLAVGITFSVILIFFLVRSDSDKENTELILDMNPLSVHLWDRSINLIYCNKKSAELFKMKDTGELLEQFYALSPEYQPCGRRSSELVEEYINLAFKEGTCGFDWEHCTLDGEMLPMEITLVRIPYKKDFAVIAYARDLREHKKMMEDITTTSSRLELERSTLNTMFELAPDPIFCKDMDLKYTRCNESFLACFGMQRDEVLGKTALESFALPDVTHDSINGNDDQVLEKRQIIKYEEYLPFPDGKIRIMETYKIPLFQGDEMVGIMGIARDVTERKEMEEAAKNANRAKSAFLANMSHEIRTPMNSILGIAEMLRHEKSVENHARKALDKIYNSGELLRSIINDLLDLSKIEAGKFELTPVKYEVASLLNDTTMLNMTRLGSKPIEFRLSLGEDIPATLYGDELRIKQILNNLLSNAFKYTKSGSIVFSASAEETEEDIQAGIATIIFTVTDTGLGMSDEQISKLFDEYSRFNAEANRTTQGTGLGMSITRNLLNMMHGEIFVSSQVNVGSEFTVRIPQKKIGSEVIGKELAQNLQTFRMNSVKQISKSQIVIEPMPYGKILIVDDVESNLYVAKGLMKPYDLKIETVTSGYDAIEKVKNGNVYDIIFMDHMMPLMDGVETTKLLRELSYNHPVIALTANAVVGQADMFLENGFDGFVSKPIDIRELNSVLKEFVRDKQPLEVIEAARLQKESELNMEGAPVKAPPDPELVEIFIRDISKALSTLQTIHEHCNAYTDKDIQSYIVTTHGIKSTLANIGEQELSDVALSLEQAGRNRNFIVMANETQIFLDTVVSLINKLTPMKEVATCKTTDSDLPDLRQKLLVVRDACSTYDKKAAKDLVSELRQKEWSGTINEKLQTISEDLLHGYFEKAATTAEDLLIKV
jgi:PAS domain S-box-containing protein